MCGGGDLCPVAINGNGGGRSTGERLQRKVKEEQKNPK
jgi:hypothetical protein